MFKELELKNKIHILRQRWVKEKDPIDRGIIERQGLLLKKELADLESVEKSANETSDLALKIFI